MTKLTPGHTADFGEKHIYFVKFVGDVIYGHIAIFFWIIKFVLLSVFGGNFMD